MAAARGVPRAAPLRPMPSIGKGCHELRVRDGGRNRRIFYRLEPDCSVILDVMQKKTQKTPAPVIAACRCRLADYLAARAVGKRAGEP